jgi:hypothetical protein
VFQVSNVKKQAPSTGASQTIITKRKITEQILDHMELSGKMERLVVARWEREKREVKKKTLETRSRDYGLKNPEKWSLSQMLRCRRDTHS